MKFFFMILMTLIFFIHTVCPSQDSNDLDPLIELIVESSDAQLHLDVLKGIFEALKGQRDVEEPKAWPKITKILRESPLAEVRELSHLLSLKFGSQIALVDLRDLLVNKSVSSVKRIRALNSLLEVKDVQLPVLLIDLIDDLALQQPAIIALAAFDKPEISKAILHYLPKLKLQARRDALSTMASRLTYASVLMAAINKKIIDAKILPAEIVRQLRMHNDSNINQQLDRLCGISRSSSKTKLDEIKKYKRIVGMRSNMLANLSNGRALFNRVCASCHKLYGMGGDIGPDITGSDRKNLHYILSNIIDPNAEIPNDYRTSVIRMKDNRVMVGLIRSRELKTITVVTPNEVITLLRNDVAKIDSQNFSIMPEGLIQVFSDQELIDLISYLEGNEQVPLP